MVPGNDSKYCNVTELEKTVFQKFPDYFPILRKACFFVLLQGCFKKAGIQFRRNNVLPNEDKEY